jgi:hypothetical protein
VDTYIAGNKRIAKTIVIAFENLGCHPDLHSNAKPGSRVMVTTQNMISIKSKSKKPAL